MIALFTTVFSSCDKDEVTTIDVKKINVSLSYFDKYSIDYVVALFLENDHCYFYDKKNNNNIKQVVVEYWGDSSAPLAGAGGRRFYIYDNVLFMGVTDWIS